MLSVRANVTVRLNRRLRAVVAAILLTSLVPHARAEPAVEASPSLPRTDVSPPLAGEPELPPRCLADTPLHVAVVVRDVAAVARIIGATPDLRSAPNALGETPLHIAARSGDVVTLRLLLRGVGGELEAPDSAAATPLLRALASGREAAARLLLGAGADVQSATGDGLTALHLAGRRGLAALVPALARQLPGDNPEQRQQALAAALARADTLGLTPIDQAALSGSRPTVQAFLALGAALEKTRFAAFAGQLRTETMVFACGLGRTALVTWIGAQLQRGARGAGRPLDRALEMAAAGMRPVARVEATTVACLLDAGATVSSAAFRGALAAGRSDVAALLVLRSQAHFGEERGDPLLHAAAVYGDVGLVQLLVAFGAKVDAVDAEGATALHRAILAKSGAGVRALLAVGDDGQATFRGTGAIGLALHTGSAAVLTALTEVLGLDARSAVALGKLEALAGILARDPAMAGRAGDDGFTPLQVAARFGSLAAARALVAAGAPLDAAVGEGVELDGRDVSGWTALHFAAFYGHAEIYRWLVAVGTEDRVAGDGELARAKARFSLSGAGQKGAEDDDASIPGLGWNGWGFGGGGRDSNASAPPPRPVSPVEAAQGDRPSDDIGMIGSAGGRGMPSSFIGLGGGLLRDERRIDEELVPVHALVGTGSVEPVDPALPAALERCLVAAHWFEAERIARSILAERELAPIPGTLAGIGWDGHRLLEASALQTLGRVLIERRRFAEADKALTGAGGALEKRADRADQGAAQLLPVHHLWAAIAQAKARLHRRMGLLDEAEADLVAGLARLVGEAVAGLRAGIAGKLAIVLGESARYREAIERAREALRLTLASRSSERPSPHALWQNLATLLARAGERVEAKALVMEELGRVSRGEVLDVEDASMIRYAAGLWRLLDGAQEEGESLIVAAREDLAAIRPEHPALGRFDLGLGLALTGMQRHDEAAIVLRRGEAALLASEDVSDIEALSPGAASDYARVLAARAAIERIGGRADAALELARTAYAMVVGLQALEARWQIELELARIEAARGLRKDGEASTRDHLAVAIFFGKRAVKTLERIRAFGVPPALARAFVDDRLAAWRELADNLVRAGRLLEATAALAGLKDDETAGFTASVERGGRTGEKAEKRAGAPMPDVGSEKQGDRPELPVKAAQREANKLAEVVRAGDPNVPASARLDQARKTLRERRRAFEAWLQSLEGELNGMAPARAQAIAAMNLRDLASLQETLGTLGNGVVMVHYLITADRVRAIVTTADSQVGREAPIKQADLNALVFQFRQVLADPTRDAKAAANALYDVLIRPIETDLAEAHAETLLVSLDGALRYAPLAALWDGRQWLVERYRIVHFARAALHTIMASRPPEGSLAAFGCGRAVPGFQALTAVPAELESIVKRDAADPDGELPGVVRLDDAFSRASLTALLEEKRYSTIHIASHFVLGPGGESESYLLLGDGQKLSLEDIRYDLRFDGVDLLSLSACNTAVGDQANDGREIEGFASLAMRLGARAVLATLWPVSDASTGLFMRTLYRLIKADPKRSRADVLRLAMLSFIRGEVSLPKAEPEPGGRGPRPLALATANAAAIVPFGAAGVAAGTEPPRAGTPVPIDLSHPRYWAPFVFIGNWR